jgi:GNAT superfamily N-acetyltransferase
MTAYDGKKSIADTVFMPYGSGGRMISGQTYVHPAYRGKGVAAGMYAYLRMLGFKIEPSAIRTGAGKAMWDKWEKAGDAKHLSKGVAEGLEQDYLTQIPNLTWKPVSRSVWNTIQDEGLDEEQDAPKHTDWIMASLTISPEDARALQAFDNDAIDDFNRFDIHLKSRHPGLTDLIDYDRGTVTIVKPIQMQGVAEGKINLDSSKYKNKVETK